MGRAPQQSSWTPLTPPDPLFTFEERTDLPHGGRPFPVVLAQRQLHVEQGHPSDDEEQGVRDQEGACRTQRPSVSPATPRGTEAEREPQDAAWPGPAGQCRVDDGRLAGGHPPALARPRPQECGEAGK